MHTYSFFCVWIKHRCIIFNALLSTLYNSLFICIGAQVFPILDWHTPIYGSPFKSIAFDLWTFPIDSYVQIVSDMVFRIVHFQIFWHWLILCKWMFTPDLSDWMAYHAPLIPWFWTFSWLCAEWSQNTILLASTQAAYKSPHSTVSKRICQSALNQRASASRKSQSVRLEHVAH